MFVKPEVLVVCRTAAGRMYLGVLLNRIWYHPLLVRSSEEGVHHAQRTAFAMALLDGDVDAEELRNSIAVLRTHPRTRHLPLIVFSSSSDAAYPATLRDLGCTEVLPRPIDFSRTYATLARLVGQPRRQARIEMNLDVTIEEKTPESVLVCTNLSEGGMFLRAHTPPDQRSLLHVRFILPGDDAVIASTAEVMHHRPLGSRIEQVPGMGVRFTTLAERDVERIRRFVHHQTLGDLSWQ